MLTGLLVVGALSIVVGGVLALRQDVLKQVLAYSTISQYGYVVLLYGIGGAAGNGAAAFYVLAHGVAKSALFMAAGAVTMATGEDRLSRLGGLAPPDAGAGGRRRARRGEPRRAAADRRVLQGRAVLHRRARRGPGDRPRWPWPRRR